eukprot:UC1_evm1s1669
MSLFKKSGGNKGAGAVRSYTLSDYGGDGIEFTGKYLGRIPVAEPKGQQFYAVAMQSAKARKGDKKVSFTEQHHKCVLRVSINGIRCCEQKTGSTISQHAVHCITSCCVDEKDADHLGVFIKGEGGQSGKAGEFACLCIKSGQSTQLLHALETLLQLAYSHGGQQTSSNSVANVATAP